MVKKRLLGWAGLVAAAGAAALLAPEPAPVAPQRASVQPPKQVPAPAAKSSPAQPERLAALPGREAIGRRDADPFTTQSWAPPPAPPPKPVAAPVAVEPPAPPSPPPMPYRVAGRLVHEGGPQIVLANGDRVFTVRQGDMLEGGYRVEAINARSVTLVYTPLDVAQQLAVAPSLELEPQTLARGPVSATTPQAPVADSSAAKLRWEGPSRIRAGDAFSVALKVTSPEAVRSAPLQVSFDAELLEALDVRRGGFFADGSFSYRISPSGSIFIGASGKGAVPADAEFFVVTFKPMRAGATAELKLSSVLLQGAAGRAIAHDQPVAFRTSIVQ